MPLDPVILQAIMQAVRGQSMPVGDVVPFTNPNQTIVPLPEPNQGYMPSAAEAELIRKFFERGTVIPFPKGNK